LKNNILKSFKYTYIVSKSAINNCIFKIDIDSININSLKNFEKHSLINDLIIKPKRLILLFLKFLFFDNIYKLVPIKIIKLMKKDLYLRNLIKKIKSKLI